MMCVLRVSLVSMCVPSNVFAMGTYVCVFVILHMCVRATGHPVMMNTYCMCDDIIVHEKDIFHLTLLPPQPKVRKTLSSAVATLSPTKTYSGASFIPSLSRSSTWPRSSAKQSPSHTEKEVLHREIPYNDVRTYNSTVTHYQSV